MRGFPFGRAEEHLRHIPLVAALGLRFTRIEPGMAGMIMPATGATPTAPGGPPHPGAIIALLDHLASCSVFATIPDYRPTATLDLRIDLIAIPDLAGDITAQATCLALDGDIAHAQAQARQADGRLIATCSAIFMIGSFPGSAPGEDNLAQPEGPWPPPPPSSCFPDIFKVEETATGFALPPSKHLIGSPLLPALHGGAVGAFLLEAAIRSGGGRQVRSLSVQYLRAAPAGRLTAQVRVERAGRRSTSLSLTARSDEGGPPLALAQCSLAD